MRLALLLVAAAAVPAYADAPSATASATAESPPAHTLAIAVNEPLGWIHGDAIAIAAYGALTQHQVLRASYSTWTEGWGQTFDPIVVDGGYTSVAGAWMYFLRRPYDGLSLEAGAVVKRRNTNELTDDIHGSYSEIATTLVAASTMVGWSWLIGGHAFISLNVGASLGWERGHQTDTGGDTPMATTTAIHHVVLTREAMLRFGVAFDLL